jgi:uncharacterized protein (TIGR03382 family)
MGRTFALTLALAALPAIAAAHPRQLIHPDGTARTGELVATRPSPHGLVFARQVLAATAHATAQVQSKVIYLNHDGVTLTPGDNDSSTQTSSIVTEQADVGGWDIDDASWAATVACVQNMYAAFDVKVTDQDPGNVPHIEALIGGSPADVGLPDNVAGVSPFTADCSVIENSIAFTFTDVLNDDPQTICEVVSQEIAHSFGLDHEMLPSDPMTYLDYNGDRSFQDDMATCGEYDGRMCGINGSVCREKQNSVQLLTARLGAAGGSDPTAPDPGTGGCAAGGTPGTGGVIGLALLALARRRRAMC